MPDPGLVWLLDKNVVRKAIEGIGALLVAVPLTTEQSLSENARPARSRTHSISLKPLPYSSLAIMMRPQQPAATYK
jgi:hypothetical protein